MYSATPVGLDGTCIQLPQVNRLHFSFDMTGRKQMRSGGLEWNNPLKTFLRYQYIVCEHVDYKLVFNFPCLISTKGCVHG